MINPDGLFFGDTLIYGCLIFIVYLHCYHFEGLGTKFLLTTFYNFFDTSCFLKSKKIVKYVFSNTHVFVSVIRPIIQACLVLASIFDWRLLRELLSVYL